MACPEQTRGDFAKAGSNCPATLPAGASCSTDVTFTPTGLGLRTAALTFTDNAGNAAGAAQQVPLSGNGTQAVATLSPFQRWRRRPGRSRRQAVRRHLQRLRHRCGAAAGV